VVRDALLESDPAPPPSSTATLARFHWPLVLTTNYDDFYVAAAQAEFLRTRIGVRRNTSEAERRTPAIEVVGRSPSDCHRVLSALRRSARPLVWTLQGFLPGRRSFRSPPDKEHDSDRTECWVDYVSVGVGCPGFSSTELERQLVVGHAEYGDVQTPVQMKTGVGSLQDGQVIEGKDLRPCHTEYPYRAHPRPHRRRLQLIASRDPGQARPQGSSVLPGDGSHPTGRPVTTVQRC